MYDDKYLSMLCNLLQFALKSWNSCANIRKVMSHHHKVKKIVKRRVHETKFHFLLYIM